MGVKNFNCRRLIHKTRARNSWSEILIPPEVSLSGPFLRIFLFKLLNFRRSTGVLSTSEADSTKTVQGSLPQKSHFFTGCLTWHTMAESCGAWTVLRHFLIGTGIVQLTFGCCKKNFQLETVMYCLPRIFSET